MTTSSLPTPPTRHGQLQQRPPRLRGRTHHVGGAGRILEVRLEESLGAGVRRFKRADAQDPSALGPDWAARLEVIAVALASDVSLDRQGATMDLARERQECLKPSLPPRLRRRG